MNVGACDVCANIKVDLIYIDYGHLRNQYNNVCGFQTKLVTTGSPSYICRFCDSLIKRINNFQEQCQATMQALQEIFTAVQENTKRTLIIDSSNVWILPSSSHASPETLLYEETEIKNLPIPKISQLLQKDKDLPCFKIQIPNKSSKSLNAEKNVMEYDGISIEENRSGSGDLFHNFTDTDLNENILEINAGIISIKNRISNVSELKQNEREKDILNSIEQYIKIVPINKKDAMAAYELKLAIKKEENQKYDKDNVCDICHCEIPKNKMTCHHLTHERTNTRVYCQICKLNLKSTTTDKHDNWYHNYKFICKICSEVNFSIPDASQHFISYHGVEKDRFKALIHECPIKEYIGREYRSFAQKSTVKTSEQDTYVYFSKILGKLAKKLKPKTLKRQTTKKPEAIPSHIESHFTKHLCTPEEMYQAMLDRKESYYYKVALYKCEFCFKVHLREDKLKRHYELHSPSIGNYQCEYCKRYFAKRHRLMGHFRLFHDFRYQCKECDFQTYSYNVTLTHKMKHLDRKISCDKCDRIFNTRQAMYSHNRFAHPAMAVCSLCGQGFGKESGMHVHRKLLHRTQLEKEQIARLEKEKDSSNEFYCKECDIQFLDGTAFDNHLKSSWKHTEVNQEYRKEHQSIKDALILRKKIIREKMVEETETPNKMVQDRDKTIKCRPRAESKIADFNRSLCPLCGILLKNTTYARIHYNRYHPDDEYYKNNLKRIYQCPLCDFTTVTPNRLYSHKIVKHTTEKPYKCSNCDMAFKFKKNMERHNLIHTGEKNFACPHCPKRFAQKQSCKLHIQTVHLKIPYPPWQKKYKRNREKRQKISEKTTSKRTYSNEVEQEVVEEYNALYLEEQELATDYIVKDIIRNKNNRETTQNRSEKTTNRRKYSNEVEQEVVEEDNALYLEEQELATEYIVENYSTTSSEGSARVRIVSFETPTKRYRLH